MKNRIWLLLFFLIGLYQRSNAQFPCNTTVYMSQEGTATQGTQLKRYDMNTKSLTNIGARSNYRYNGMVYASNGFLYAFETNGGGNGTSNANMGSFLRISNTGTVTNLGYIVSGGVSTQGKRFISSGMDGGDHIFALNNQPAGSTGSLYKISSITTTPSIVQIPLSNTNILILDIAMGSDGSFYGTGEINGQSNRLVRITQTGIVTDMGPAIEEAGAAFADNGDNLYFAANTGNIYRWKIGTPSTSMTYFGPANGQWFLDNDAAACRMAFTENVDPGITNGITATATTSTATSIIQNNSTGLATDVITSFSIPANLQYASFTVEDANGNVVPESSLRWSVVSQPAANASNTNLVLNFHNLLPGAANGYKVILNTNRSNPNTAETLNSTAQITSTNGVAFNNNDLTLRTDNNNGGLVGDVATNNDANASVSVAGSGVNLSGTVFHDPDGGAINGTGTNVGGVLIANLYNLATNTVIANTAVAANGTYSFASVAPGNYAVVLNTTPGSSTASLPSGWVNTAEGLTSAGDGVVNGAINPIAVGASDVINANFGIEQLPTPTPSTLASQTNPGGANTVNITTAFTGTDPDGNVTQIHITGFPTNATSITIGGIIYGPSGTAFPAAGVTVPVGTAILLDPTDGGVTSVIPFKVIDNAGQESTGSANVTVPFSIPLPVTLVSFTARLSGDRSEGAEVLINWSTTSETNSDHFEIEHSLNGKEWGNLTTVKAAGESKTLVPYSYMHATPVNGSNLYRLKMIDKDGTFAYSRIQEVDVKSSLTAVIYPNPTSDKLHLEVTNPELVKGMELYNSNGILVLSVNKSNDFNIKDLPNGIYIVRVIRLDGTSTSLKVIKQ